MENVPLREIRENDARDRLPEDTVNVEDGLTMKRSSKGQERCLAKIG